MPTQSADGSGKRIDSPLEILAEELGHYAGRLEREIKQMVALELERMARKLAEMQTSVAVSQHMLAERLTMVRDGSDGEDGEDGKDGADGKDGVNGKDGTNGINGKDGADGIAGRDGVNGIDGSNGTDGKDGLNGVPGEPGPPGRSFRPRGVYDTGAVYSFLDFVALNGASFVALKDNPGPCPGEGWQLVARQGKPGIQGPPGASAAGIVGWRLDDYSAIPLMSDGKDGPRLDLRVFFEAYHREVGNAA